MDFVLDNNVLFSIMNPESTSAYLFSSIRAKFSAPEFLKSELEKHKEECLFKSKLSEQQFKSRQKDVEEFITFLKPDKYEIFLDKATESLEDPDDADFLALALSINASIWSNDPHLKQQSLVKVFTTEDLLKMFLNNEI